MFREIKNYVMDQEFRMNIYPDKVNVINYRDILTIQIDRISLKYRDGVVIIRGKDLVLKKLLDEELLIIGHIKSVELE